MKLVLAVICDNAFTDIAGRLNIIQAFDTVYAPDFPAIQPKLSVVTKLEFENQGEKSIEHTYYVIIRDTMTQKEIIKTSETKLKASSDRSKSLQFISNIIGLKLENPGIYKIEFYLDGSKIKDETFFEVTKPTKV